MRILKFFPKYELQKTILPYVCVGTLLTRVTFENFRHITVLTGLLACLANRPSSKSAWPRVIRNEAEILEQSLLNRVSRLETYENPNKIILRGS